MPDVLWQRERRSERTQTPVPAWSAAAMSGRLCDFGPTGPVPEDGHCWCCHMRLEVAASHRPADLPEGLCVLCGWLWRDDPLAFSLEAEMWQRRREQGR